MLNFCSFICTIKIIFPSAIFGYLWRCWYFFPYFFSWTGQIVPFRLSICGQFRLYSVLQFVRTCHFEAIIFRNAAYPKSVNRVVENVCIEKAIIQSHRVNHNNMFVWWHMESYVCSLCLLFSVKESFLLHFSLFVSIQLFGFVLW